MEITIKLNLEEMLTVIRTGSLEKLGETLKNTKDTTIDQVQKDLKADKPAAPKTGKAAKPAEIPEGFEEIKEEPAAAPADDDDNTEPKHSMEEIRAKLNELNKAGKRAEIQALFAKFGVKKFTDVDKSDYDKLMAEALKL